MRDTLLPRDQLAVEHEPSGQVAEFGQFLSHVPAASASYAESVDRRDDRAEAVPFRFELPAGTGGDGPGRDNIGSGSIMLWRLLRETTTPRFES